MKADERIPEEHAFVANHFASLWVVYTVSHVIASVGDVRRRKVVTIVCLTNSMDTVRELNEKSMQSTSTGFKL